MTQHIRFSSRNLELEGLWSRLSPTNAAVITHPHPLYGGDMHNAVVDTISTAYHSRGWSTLRFNFRGAGNSDGAFDNGVGEQLDIHGAIEFVKTKGMTDIELAGYSFGAWVLSGWDRRADDESHPMRFIAPPVGFLDFNPIQSIKALQQVVVGKGDEFAPLEQCESHVQRWNPKATFDVLEDADHFFWDQMDALQRVLETDIALKKV